MKFVYVMEEPDQVTACMFSKLSYVIRYTFRLIKEGWKPTLLNVYHPITDIPKKRLVWISK